jgi:hypothetical protein
MKEEYNNLCSLLNITVVIQVKLEYRGREWGENVNCKVRSKETDWKG